MAMNHKCNYFNKVPLVRAARSSQNSAETLEVNRMFASTAMRNECFDEEDFLFDLRGYWSEPPRLTESAL